MPKAKITKTTPISSGSVSRTPVKINSTGTPRWYLAIMFGLMLLGLAWLIVYYLAASSTTYGGEGQVLHWMANLGSWNFLIGFALMVAGLLMTMRWR